MDAFAWTVIGSLAGVAGAAAAVVFGVIPLLRGRGERQEILPGGAGSGSAENRAERVLAAADREFAVQWQEYLACVRRRFRRVDLEVLTPLTEQEEHPEMLLGSVFVPQMVRADPPPVELPREVWRRLEEGGEIGSRDLPADLDKDEIVRRRQAYRERPALPVLDTVAGAGGQRLVLLGDPGAGKSTLARYLMLALASEDERSGESPGTGRGIPAGLAGCLPLLVELRVYADPRWQDRTFLDLIDYLYATEDLGLPVAALEGFLRSGGRAIVIFDGLDEVFDPLRREQVTRQVEAFASRYPQSRVIVTSRPVGYQRAFLDAAGFAHYMLQDLDQDQVKVFTTAWYRASWPGNRAEGDLLNERLLGAVQSSAAVAELAGNPMLLTILAIIGRRRKLPRDRLSVYKHAVSVLVEHWDATGKHLNDTRTDSGMPYLDYEDKLEVLRLVARRMQDGPAGLAGNHIAEQDLRAQFDRYLRKQFELPADRSIPAAKAMLEQLRERNFILARFGGGAYGFVHRVFLEYLAADDIYQRFSDHEITGEELLDVFRRHWNDPAWQEVLLLLTGMIPENFTAKMIDWLMAADPLWHLRSGSVPQHVLLALNCLAEARKPGGLSRQSRAVAIAVTALLEGSADTFDYELINFYTEVFQKSAIQAFASLGPNWAGRRPYDNWYTVQGQFLGHGNGPYVISLAEIAGRLHIAFLRHDDSQTRRHLQALAAASGPASTRRVAVQALAAGWRDDPATAGLLRERAVSDDHGDVRRVAVQALAAGWRDDPATAELLRERAVSDDDGGVREVAVQALAAGWRDDPATLPWLRERAVGDDHGDVREVAVQALAAGWRDDPATLPWLRERAVGDDDGDVREVAVQALAAGWRDDPATAGLLRERAVSDDDGDVRRVAVQALAAGWRDDPATAELLRERAVGDDHGDVRRVAVQALAAGWRDDPATAELLRERAVSDDDGGVREVAVQALAAGWRDDPATLPWLRERAVGDDHGDVRRVAVQALAAGWRDDPATLPWLRERAVGDDDGDVREVAVQALAAGWRDDPATAELLRERAVSDDDGDVRRAAVQALAAGWRDDPATAELLRERAVGDDHGDVREVAVQALAAGWRDDPATLPWLRERAVGDDHGDVREVAVQALAAGWRDDPATAGLLRERAVGDDDGAVRRAAVQALAAGWRDDPATLPWLRERAVSDDDGGVRRVAVQALAAGWRDDPATAELLRERAVGDDDGDVRRAAVQALAAGWRDDPATLPWLRERAVSDDDGDVREVAVQALAAGWRDDPATAGLLRERAVGDDDGAVREVAVQALAAGWRDDPATLPWLRERAVGDDDGAVREVAVQALAAGWRDDPATAELLRERAVSDDDGDVRRAAVQALAAGWRDDPATAELLRERAVSDDHWGVREAAVQALATR